MSQHHVLHVAIYDIQSSDLYNFLHPADAMSSGVSVGASYVLGSLPRPLDKAQGQTYGSFTVGLADSKVRKRHEIASAVDGEGIYIHKVGGTPTVHLGLDADLKRSNLSVKSLHMLYRRKLLSPVRLCFCDIERVPKVLRKAICTPSPKKTVGLLISIFSAIVIPTRRTRTRQKRARSGWPRPSRSWH